MRLRDNKGGRRTMTKSNVSFFTVLQGMMMERFFLA
jgi:hypothetical protein